MVSVYPVRIRLLHTVSFCITMLMVLMGFQLLNTPSGQVQGMFSTYGVFRICIQKCSQDLLTAQFQPYRLLEGRFCPVRKRETTVFGTYMLQNRPQIWMSAGFRINPCNRCSISTQKETLDILKIFLIHIAL